MVEVISFLALDNRGRLYIALGHGSRQSSNIILKELVFTLELVMIGFDLVYSFCQSL